MKWKKMRLRTYKKMWQGPLRPANKFTDVQIGKKMRLWTYENMTGPPAPSKWVYGRLKNTPRTGIWKKWVYRRMQKCDGAPRGQQMSLMSLWTYKKCDAPPPCPANEFTDVRKIPNAKELEKHVFMDIWKHVTGPPTPSKWVNGLTKNCDWAELEKRRVYGYMQNVTGPPAPSKWV